MGKNEHMTQEERLEYLIRALIEEGGTFAGSEMPAGTAERKRLLRALMNVRPPGAADPAFLRIQDAYLKEELVEKGITDAQTIAPVRGRLCLWQGDITTLRCGAIVNAANSRMLGCFVPCHGCVDNAVHTYAGIQLRQACMERVRGLGGALENGRTVLTGAYNLPCEYVLHTVGPVVTGVPTEKDRTELDGCYRSCMELANRAGIRSIAFCCISTGEFHFPNGEAARIAVAAVEDCLPGSCMERVIFNVYKKEDYDIYCKLLGAGKAVKEQA